MVERTQLVLPRSAAVLNVARRVHISYVLCEETLVRTVSLDPEDRWIRRATSGLLEGHAPRNDSAGRFEVLS